MPHNRLKFALKQNEKLTWSLPDITPKDGIHQGITDTYFMDVAAETAVLRGDCLLERVPG